MLWAQFLGLASSNSKLSLGGEADQAWKQAPAARKSLPEGKDQKLEPSWMKGFRELPPPARYTVMCPRGAAMLEAGSSRSFYRSWKRDVRDAQILSCGKSWRAYPPNTLVQRLPVQTPKTNISSIFLTTCLALWGRQRTHHVTCSLGSSHIQSVTVIQPCFLSCLHNLAWAIKTKPCSRQCFIL